jgi:hypothetical protein
MIYTCLSFCVGYKTNYESKNVLNSLLYIYPGYLLEPNVEETWQKFTTKKTKKKKVVRTMVKIPKSI